MFQAPNLHLVMQLLIINFHCRFVLVNSIALQGDECSMCSEAMTQLMNVANKLNCHRERSSKKVYEDVIKKEKKTCDLPKDSPAPILIQVLDIFRTSSCCDDILRHYVYTS